MAAAYASQTPKVVLEFLTITHPSLATPIYVVNNSVAITRGGNVFAPFAFKVDLPVEKDGEIGNAKLTIDAVDLSIITSIRSITTPATVAIVIALSDTPDTTEVDLGSFTWKNIIYNSLQVTGDLTYDEVLDILIPALTFTPQYVPGNF
jgi:hypothetical protein